MNHSYKKAKEQFLSNRSPENPYNNPFQGEAWERGRASARDVIETAADTFAKKLSQKEAELNNMDTAMERAIGQRADAERVCDVLRKHNDELQHTVFSLKAGLLLTIAGWGVFTIFTL